MKIAVLMSGGIDSSFAAFCLRARGYDVTGVTFLEIGDKIEKGEILRAKRVAEVLSIPHIVLNTKNIYEKEIIQPFCRTLLKGETPNACPFCNRKIKFGLVLEKLEKKGIKKVATGHYVKGGYNSQNQRWFLRKAEDKRKDQSYFLWKLSQGQISKTIFPLGDFIKEEVKRQMEKKFPKIFSTKNYKESQDICFLREENLSDFLRKKFKEKPGPIYNTEGKKIGEHPGTYFFTIGQRTGLKIGAKTPTQRPLFVLDIQAKNNAIVVGKEQYLFGKELRARDLNWISIEPPQKKIKVKARVRYRHKESEAEVFPLPSNKAKVIFKDPQRAIAPGQHVVFFKKDLLLGGGIIERLQN